MQNINNHKIESMWPPVIACLIVQLCVGILYLWSVFRSDIVNTFQWSDKSAAMVASYMLMSFVCGNLIGGYLNDKKGPKLTIIIGIVFFAFGIGSTGFLNSDNIGMIFLTYCIIGGLGSGFAYIACLSCIQKWMAHRRGLGSGLAVSAFGLSTVIFAPVSKMIILQFTDQATGLVNFKSVFLTLAAIFFVIGMIATFFIKLPSKQYLDNLPVPESNKNMVSKRDYSPKEAMRTSRFWYICAFMFFINATWNLAVPLIKGLAIDRGLTEGMAVFAVSITGITNAGGRLIMAFVSDKIGRITSNVILAIMTLVAALLMTFVSGPMYIVVVASIAFAFGGPAAINPAICTDFFGTKYAGTNYGISMISLGLSAIVNNWLSANILGGAVIPTFIMAAITALISALFMLLIGRQLKNLDDSKIS